jgi:hypothetical protein
MSEKANTLQAIGFKNLLKNTKFGGFTGSGGNGRRSHL